MTLIFPLLSTKSHNWRRCLSSFLPLLSLVRWKTSPLQGRNTVTMNKQTNNSNSNNNNKNKNNTKTTLLYFILWNEKKLITSERNTFTINKQKTTKTRTTITIAPTISLLYLVKWKNSPLQERNTFTTKTIAITTTLSLLYLVKWKTPLLQERNTLQINK